MDILNIIFWIGRILFGGYFFMMGLNHFMKHEMLKKYAESKGIKNSSFMIYASGILIILGGLGVILGISVPEALALIVIFLIPVSIKMHAFWKESEDATKMIEMQNFLKNIALAGAALMLIFFTLNI
jgi:uncharacterized membrane protein YphA (DoxX/SURF4 family)